MNKQQIAEKLVENHQKFTDFLVSLNETDFIASTDEKWTAGQQLEHIIRGVSPVKTALNLPKIVPHLLFGKSNRDSIEFEKVVKNYQEKLAAGGKASGRFIPPEIGFEKREELVEKLMKTVAALNENVETFSEIQLDEYVLPHPILGKLTLREMLYFTIYHVEHHHQNALRNLGRL